MKSRGAPIRFSLLAILMLSVASTSYGYDLFGNDIAGLDVQNPDQCASACASNSNCLAWTFVRAGLKGPSARCFLKNPVPTPSMTGICASNYDCISGLKRTDAWCGDKPQGDVLSCDAGAACLPRTSRSCSGWWIFRNCTTIQTTDFFCQ